MGDIMTVGEILVEVMAKETNQQFDTTGEFVGPFPSGAPAIFIDQAAKVGSETMIISAVGKDGFGKLNLKRLKSDGVNTKAIKELDDLPTGVAFVTYQESGSRDFIFHLTNSSAGQINEDMVKEEYFEDLNYFHVMGSAVYNKKIQEAIKKGIFLAKKHGVKITFDPNVRKEILNDTNKKNFLSYVLSESNIVIAGDEELSYLIGDTHEETVVQDIFTKSAEIIIVKKGKNGATLYLKNDEKVIIPPLPVEEVDPTGAGDCFAGTFVSCLNQGISPIKSAKLSAIAGGLAVTKQGPMEGNSTYNELEEYYRKL